MDPITLLFLGIGVATIVIRYRSSQKAAPVAPRHQVPVPEGGLTAIEYFWRPG